METVKLNVRLCQTTEQMMLLAMFPWRNKIVCNDGSTIDESHDLFNSSKTICINLAIYYCE